MEKNRLKDIGVVAKPRGIKGGVIIRLDTPVTEEIENAESLFLLVEGRAVPLLPTPLPPSEVKQSSWSSDGMILLQKFPDFRDAGSLSSRQRRPLQSCPAINHSLAFPYSMSMVLFGAG